MYIFPYIPWWMYNSNNNYFMVEALWFRKLRIKYVTMWYCYVVTWRPLASHHKISPTALSAERCGESILYQRQPFCKGLAKTKDNCTSSGSSAHRQQGARLPSLSFQGHSWFLLFGSWLQQTMLSIWDELGIPRRKVLDIKQGAKDSLPLPGHLPFWGSFSFLPLRVPAYWDVPHMAGSAPSGTLLDADGIGCTWPHWVSTPGTLGLCLWFCYPRGFFGVSKQSCLPGERSMVHCHAN